MELQRLRVQNYKSIEDSGWVEIEDLTCLMGKNESGKTAFMQAVERLNPRFRSEEYLDYKEYPRSEWVDYEQRRENGAGPDDVVSAEFRLNSYEKLIIEREYGESILADDEVVVTKNYNNQLQWDVPIDEDIFIDSVLDEYEIPTRTEDMLRDAETVEELHEKIDESTSTDEVLDEILEEVDTRDPDWLAREIGSSELTEKVPEFHYMGDYSILDAIISVNDLLRKDKNDDLDDSDAVFMALLSIVNLDLQELRDEPDWERIITRLEAASGHVTKYMMDYWTQNENITIQFNREQADPDGPSDYDEGDLLQIRVKNPEYDDVTTIEFDQRSRGFRWFFSSFCHFSNMRNEEDQLILLLDEPGLHLHARAQQDFLTFLDEELSQQHTVIYSTHSPFMLDPRNLSQAKLVIRERDAGTTISSDVLQTDEDTRFPLQTVFEFDLIDTLLIRPQTLLVEGKSDQIYIYTMSEILDERDRTSLDKRWTVLNAGSGDNIPMFISLFGANDLDLAALLDADGKYQSRLNRIEDTGEIDAEHVKPISEFINSEYGDIEELFSPEFYLELVNGAYRRELYSDPETLDEITLDHVDGMGDNGDPRIVKRLEDVFHDLGIDEGVFRHTAPAHHFQNNQDKLKGIVDDTTLNNFESLFEEFNDILSTFD